MKINYSAILLAALTLLSCVKDNNSGKEAGSAKLSIRIKGEIDTPVGKAIGNPSQADESKVNNFILYVFKGSGENDIVPQEYTSMPLGGKISGLEITTDAKEVYIIANTMNNTEVHTKLKTITKKSELQTVIGRGFEDPSKTGIPTQSYNNLWMSGNNETELKPVEGGNVTASIVLKYVCAKIRITSIEIDPSITGLTPLSVQVFNGAAASCFIPADGKTSLIPIYSPNTTDPFYVGAISMASFVNKPNIAGANNEYNYTLTGDKTIERDKNQQYFYVFENDGSSATFDGQPTILTLKCMDNQLNTVYYSVFFKNDPDDEFGYDDQVIERGNSYNITMKIKKMGNEDPTIPRTKTTIEVNITPATWKTVTVDKTYE